MTAKPILTAWDIALWPMHMASLMATAPVWLSAPPATPSAPQPEPSRPIPPPQSPPAPLPPTSEDPLEDNDQIEYLA